MHKLRQGDTCKTKTKKDHMYIVHVHKARVSERGRGREGGAGERGGEYERKGEREKERGVGGGGQERV